MNDADVISICMNTNTIRGLRHQSGIALYNAVFRKNLFKNSLKKSRTNQKWALFFSATEMFPSISINHFPALRVCRQIHVLNGLINLYYQATCKMLAFN